MKQPTPPASPAPEAPASLAPSAKIHKPQSTIQNLPGWLLAGGGYLVLTILMTWPLAEQFTTAIPAGGDAWQHLWNLWWMKRALVDLHTNPFHTDLLYYPYGVNLYFHTLVPLIGAISVPFQLLGLNLLAAYNLMVVLSFVAAGLGTYALVHYLTGSRPGAFVAGLIFTFAPYHFAHLLGQLNLTSLQWIPFYILALFKMWEPPRLRMADSGLRHDNALSQSAIYPPQSAIRNPQLWWAAGAGLWLAANAYTEWIYAMFLGLFTAWFLAWKLLIERQGPGWRAGLLRLAVLGGVAGALVAPVLVPMVQEARSATYMQSPAQDTLFYSSDLVDAFVPSPFHPVWGGIGAAVAAHFPTRHPAERVVFAGYTVLALGLLAGVAFRRRKAVLFWGATALGTWVLSLGPVLQVWGRSTFTAFGVTVPLPYLVLYYVPLLNIFRAPSRFMVLVMLALAVLVGFVLAGAARVRWRGGARPALGWGVSAVVGALVLLEFLAIPYPMAPPGYDVPFYRQLAQEPGDFAILELPLRPMSDYETYQTVHGKPIIGGYLSRQPPDRFVAETPVLRYLLPTTAVDDPVAAEAARTGLADLRRADVRYAVVHWWAFTPEEQAAMQAKLARVFPGIVSRPIPDHRMEVFPLAP